MTHFFTYRMKIIPVKFISNTVISNRISIATSQQQINITRIFILFIFLILKWFLYLLMGLKAAKNSCLTFLAANLCVRLPKSISMLKHALWSGNVCRSQECAGERESSGGQITTQLWLWWKKTNKKHVPFLASDEQHEPGKNKPTLQVCQSVQKGRKR